VATGRQAGVFVVDVDPDAGGYESVDALEDRYGHMPATLAVATGGEGLHVYLRYPTNGTIRNSAGKLGPGLDIRGDGGYVIVPPSRHRSGNLYRWTGLDDATDIAPAPEWLLSLLIESSSPSRIGARQAASDDVVEPIPEGQRNSTLTSKAGVLRRYGFSEAEIAAALLVMNADRCTPALPEEDVRRIATSVARYAPADPAAAVVLGEHRLQTRRAPLHVREVRHA
jgi:putative DNA primase/helicase